MPDSRLTPACSETSSNVSRKRRRAQSRFNREQDKSDEILSIVGQKLQDSRNQDEYDIIGKNVAEKLRKIEPMMKIYAEKLINDVLFEAQLGTLSRESCITVSSTYNPLVHQNVPQYGLEDENTGNYYIVS